MECTLCGVERELKLSRRCSRGKLYFHSRNVATLCASDAFANLKIFFLGDIMAFRFCGVCMLEDTLKHRSGDHSPLGEGTPMRLS